MIDELEQAIEGELLPETCGFFFGKIVMTMMTRKRKSRRLTI